MKPLLSKLFVGFVILSLIMGQTLPALAQENTPEPSLTSQIETPIPSVEEPPSPAETSTPTPVPSETESTPTETATAIEELNLIEIKLQTSPKTIKVGENIHLEWQVSGLTSLDTKLTLQLSLPFGFEPVINKEEVFDSKLGLLTTSLTETSGRFEIVIPAEVAEDAVFTLSIYDSTQVLMASDSIVIPIRESFEVSKSGGEIIARDGELKVTFSQEALMNKDIEVEIGAPSDVSIIQTSFSGKPFEITSQKIDGQAKVETFADPVEFAIDLNQYGYGNVKTNDVLLYWYNPETKGWEGMVSWVDEETNTLYAETEHFSIFDVGANNWEASKIPNVNAFQVSGFTGAATYSFPIEVPQGPGGLQPSLSLNYNSQVVDQATTWSQAGWVGMGWSLDTGYIELNTKNTSAAGDDTHVLHVNGISREIIPTANGYRTSDENFMKITYDSNGWKLWDKQGNIYEFSHQTNMYYSIGRVCDSGGGNSLAGHTNRWSLTKVKNIFGKELTYSYINETKNIKYYVWSAPHGECRLYGQTPSHTATYPASITYPNSRVRIRFLLEARSDYNNSYLTDDVHHSFERSRLDQVIVEQDLDGNGSFETIIKKYDLTYSTTSNRIWPNAGNPSALASIQEFGVGGSTSLPATTFTYGDAMHLTQANNGYGGIVTFAYQAWYYPTARTSYKKYWAAASPADRIKISPGGWGTFPNSGGLAVKPGGAYYLMVDNDPGTVVQLRLFDGVNYHYLPVTNDPSGVRFLPASTTSSFITAHYISPYDPEETNTKIFLSITEFSALTTIYRVTTKTIQDGNGHSYAYTYSYNGAAVNDNATSASSANNSSFSEKFSEFRGHATVTETGPDNVQTVTSYYQDDVYKGRAHNTQIKVGGVKRSQTISTYSNTVLSGFTYFTKSIPRNWTTLTSTENRIYDNNGSTYSATKTVYAYESTYGNVLTQTQQTWDGSAWVNYLSQSTEYWFNNSATRYLVSLPAKTQVLDASNAVLSETLYLYDGNTGSYQSMPTDGKLTAVRSLLDNALGYNQVSYGYDSYGNQTSQTTWTGYEDWDSNPSTGVQTTTTEYDSTYHTYPIKVTNALGQFIEMGYDYAKGVPTSLTDLNGNITTAGYDAFGRITSITRPGDASPTLSMTYTNSYPFTTTITLNPTNYTVTRKYDGMGRPIQTISGGVIVDTVYQSPTITKQSVPYTGSSPNLFTTSTVNLSANSTTITAPDGTFTTTAVNGLTTTVTDAKGYATTSTSDVWGRVKLVTPHTGPTVEYFYTEQNLMWKVIRGGAETIIDYDNAGRKTSMEDPDMGNWFYEYDALGNLTEQTDARGCVLNLDYDALNRLTDKDSSGSGCGTQISTSYTYDSTTNGNEGIGHRTSMTDASGSTAWVYDIRGRVSSETKVISGQSFTTSYTYNSADLLTSMTYPDTESVNYTYNNRMLLESVWNMSEIYASSILYDSAGRMTNLTRGDDVLDTAYTYYPWTQQGGRLDTFTTTRVSDQVELQQLDYTYDNAGNIDIITDLLSGEIQDFGYDSLHRLTSAVVTDGLANYNESYGYNATTGNLETKANSTLTYNAQVTCSAGNRTIPHAASGMSGNSYTYDCNGNQITRVVGSDTFNLIYDAENKLIEVKKNSVTIASFVYDGDGKRVKSIIGSDTTLFIGSHYEVTGSEVTKYYYAGVSRIAMRQDGDLFFVLGDHLGSTSLVTDDEGTVISETKYKAWGEIRYSSGTNPTDYTYTGQYSYTNDFGLMFYNARWYDPSLGRFAQADTIVPSGVQGLDRYAYVNNSPLNYIDPSGHYAQCQSIYCSSIWQTSTSASTVGYKGRPEPKLTPAGEQMQVLFNYYASNPNGEWNSNGREFTPADFLAWILMSEAAGDPILLRYIMEVSARQLWGNGVDSYGNPSHTAYCPSNPCTNGVFNYLGEYSESAMGRYNALQTGNYESVEQNPKNYGNLLEAGYSIENVGRDVVINPLWTTYNNNVPVHFGNYIPGAGGFGPSWVSRMCDNTPVFTNSPTGIVYKTKGQNGVFVVVHTHNQASYWSTPGKKC